MDRLNSSLIDKIRKLRALAESANVHEATAAAAAAERLIQEHNLSEAALHVGEEDEEVSHGDVTELGSAIALWQSQLLFHLSRAYQCSGLFDSSWDRDAQVRRRKYVAYGRPQDLETLRYQYAFFVSEITRLCLRASKGKGRTYANSFRLGAVRAIGDALYAERTRARSAATSTALVVVDRRSELAKSTRDQDFPNLSPRKTSPTRIDGGAYAAGQRAGAGINRSSALGAGGVRLLGKGST